MLLFRTFTIFCACSLLINFAYADAIPQCGKVTIAGNNQWPPYTVLLSSEHDNDPQSSMNLQGIGIELAEKIFAELDVPIEETTYADPVHMIQALRNGEIDLIVSTYDYPSLNSDAIIIQPAYLEDRITIAVSTNKSQDITNWNDLVGLQGVQESTLITDDQINQFFMNYLQITIKDNLITNLMAVKNGEYQYIIGSDLQLTYAINTNDLNSDLVVMKNIYKDGNIHMAFARNSPCGLYAVYVQKRLQDYKNNGTVEKIVKKYSY